LNRTEDRPLLLQANLSFQSDRDREGPLAPEGEQDTQDPFAGFLLSPLDLRFDFDNFPVNEELLRNYRTNQVGSRRSPYDLENTAQYFTVDRYRNNAYGLYNRDEIAPAMFTESGGPLGFLTLYRENRTLAAASISWPRTDSHRLQLGAEFTRYAISNYSHFLESQNFSDVYIEHPVSGAVFLENWWRFGEATITTGLRYDFFDTRARRPEFPRISSHPAFNPANPDAFFTDDEIFPRDQSHSRLSPRVQVSFPVAPRTVFRGGFAMQAQVPDFRLSLLHLNTDLSITDANTAFGTDLGFERTTTLEAGLRHQLSPNMDVDLAVYTKNLDDQLGSRLEPRFDPLLGSNRNLRMLNNDVEARIRGVDLRVEGRMGSALTAWLGYSYQDGTTEQPSGLGTVTRVARLESRPHSVVGALALTVPPDWKPGTVTGAILRNVGVYTTFRLASGTPYTSCSSGGFSDNSVISPDLCSVITSESLNEARLPTYKQLDLRLTKHFGPGNRIGAYVDARNLLNFKNVLAVFAATGKPTNPVEVNINWSADSADLASEAQQNAAYSLGGTISLGPAFADPRLACPTWTDVAGTPSAPNCVYLIRAEERFGNGDHLFDLTEQRRASEALYRAVRGEQEFTGPPRRIRVGLEVGF
jgi:hypothetical protein